MNLSAAVSSSPVVTPGLILEANRFIVRTRIEPAAAMRSISSSVFLMITRWARRLEVFLEAQGGDDGPNVVVDVGRIPGAIDPPHQPPLVVVADHGLGLVVVDPEPVLDHLRLVIVALHEPR